MPLMLEIAARGHGVLEGFLFLLLSIRDDVPDYFGSKYRNSSRTCKYAYSPDQHTHYGLLPR